MLFILTSNDVALAGDLQTDFLATVAQCSAWGRHMLYEHVRPSVTLAISIQMIKDRLITPFLKRSPWNLKSLSGWHNGTVFFPFSPNFVPKEIDYSLSLNFWRHLEKLPGNGNANEKMCTSGRVFSTITIGNVLVGDNSCECSLSEHNFLSMFTAISSAWNALWSFGLIDFQRSSSSSVIAT